MGKFYFTVLPLTMSLQNFPNQFAAHYIEVNNKIKKKIECYLLNKLRLIRWTRIIDQSVPDIRALQYMSGNTQGVKRPYLGHEVILCNTLM